MQHLRFAGLCQQLLFARLIFATGAPLCRGMAIVLPLDPRSCAIGLTVATKDFLDKLPQHTMTAPAIAAALERYASERSDVFEKARKKRPPQTHQSTTTRHRNQPLLCLCGYRRIS